MSSDLEADQTMKVWRYMSYSRFVWLLQKKLLWLSRADHLGDPWEISLAGDQLERVISRHPISPLPSTGVVRELPYPEDEKKRSILLMLAVSPLSK